MNIVKSLNGCGCELCVVQMASKKCSTMKFEIKGIWIHKVVIVWECQKIAFFDENINLYRRGSPGPLQTGL